MADGCPGADSIGTPTIVGESRDVRALRAMIEQVARGEAKVLITGESGVGKDLVARCIHLGSRRRDRPFIAVNCAGLSETLLESELFGHVRGSFTGAYRDKLGTLQLAHGGTVFLDEVGEMTLRMQALLLRFLENGEIQPVGSDRTARRVDVRVIAATNRHLPDLIAAGRFREDLMYRLKVVHIDVPPLRDRRDDVRALVRHTLQRTGRAIEFSDEAIAALEQYRWPGNIRELQNVVEQVVWIATGPTVDLEQLPVTVQPAGAAALKAAHERRRQLADELYAGLLSGTYSFWNDVYPLFLDRDITRNDVRQLIRRGLMATAGNYRSMLALFGMPESDYKRLLNFLSAHHCSVDFRSFRTCRSVEPEPIYNPLAFRRANTPPRRAAAE